MTHTRYLLTALLLATPLHAQDEDAAHRADRKRTQQLNARAAAVVERRDSRNDAIVARHARAVDAYQRAMADWRRRVIACRSGETDDCD